MLTGACRVMHGDLAHRAPSETSSTSRQKSRLREGKTGNTRRDGWARAMDPAPRRRQAAARTRNDLLECATGADAAEPTGRVGIDAAATARRAAAAARPTASLPDRARAAFEAHPPALTDGHRRASGEKAPREGLVVRLWAEAPRRASRRSCARPGMSRSRVEEVTGSSSPSPSGSPRPMARPWPARRAQHGLSDQVPSGHPRRYGSVERQAALVADRSARRPRRRASGSARSPATELLR